MRVWDSRMGQCLKTLYHTEATGQLHVTPDGRSAVGAAGKNLKQKWDIETGFRPGRICWT